MTANATWCAFHLSTAKSRQQHNGITQRCQAELEPTQTIVATAASMAPSLTENEGVSSCCTIQDKKCETAIQEDNSVETIDTVFSTERRDSVEDENDKVLNGDKEELLAAKVKEDLPGSATIEQSRDIKYSTEDFTEDGEDNVLNTGNDGCVTVDDVEEDEGQVLDVGENRTNESSQNESNSWGRMARKAGTILGGGGLVGLGTVLIFVPVPTPNLPLIFGGMVVLSKEFPAAQRQLDNGRSLLEKVCVETHEEKGQNQNHELDEQIPEKNARKKKNALKEQAQRYGRDYVLPLLEKVCTPKTEGIETKETPEEEEAAEESAAEDTQSVPTSAINELRGKELPNTSRGPLARFRSFRENLQKEYKKAEERRLQEAVFQAELAEVVKTIETQGNAIRISE